MESFEYKELMKALKGMVADFRGGPFFEVTWIGKKNGGRGPFMMGADFELAGEPSLLAAGASRGNVFSHPSAPDGQARRYLHRVRA